MLRKVWVYRGFVLSMVKRDFQSRYQGSALGALWSIIQPLAMICIYALVFSRVMAGKIGGVDDDLAYALFLMSGILCWNYLAEVIQGSQAVFISNGNLIKKANFPRACLPAAVVLSATLNFALIFGLFLLFLVVSGRFPGAVVLGFIPVLLVQQSMIAGTGVILGTLNIFFRDVAQITTIALQLWFWLTPIVYPITILPERAQLAIQWNPMTPIMRAYQNIILAGAWPDFTSFVPQAAAGLALLALGWALFRRFSGEMADEL